jgi:two-component system cell cycle sensor histidine kinase/response regulator CckA
MSKHLSQAPGETEARFRTLEDGPVPEAIIGLDHRFRAVNPRLCELLGYSEQELLSKMFEDLTHPEDLERQLEFQRQLLAGEIGTYRLEKRYVHKHGHVVWGLLHVALVRDAGGEPLHLVAQVQDISERIQTEAALREAEARLRSFFEHAPIGEAVVAPDGRFLKVNAALCEIVGYPKDELLAKTFQDITHPEDLEADLEYVRQMLAGEIRTYQMEKRYLHRLGHVVWVLLSVSLVRDEAGRPLYFLSQIQDVTERRRADEELREASARLAEAQTMASVGSWEWRPETDARSWSDEHYRIFGLDPGERLPTHEEFLGLIHPDDVDWLKASIESSFETGEGSSDEFRIVRADGTVRWLNSEREVVTDGEAIVTMRGTVQDITERKEAEQKLREAEVRYRTLVEQLPLGTYIRPVDMTKPNIYASPQVEPMLGYTAEEWLTNPDLLASIVHPDDRDYVIAEGLRVRETGEPFRGEYRYIARDGRIVWVLDETYLVVNESGEPWVQGFLLDISNRKATEEERDRLRDELHHAQKLEALGRLAGGVAHDFNNMLTAIEGYSELLLRGLDPDSPMRAHAEQIRRAARQASALPRQLLAFSRKQASQPARISLDDVVADASDLLRRLVGESIDLIAAPGSGPARVLADPALVEQVLLNLAINARDAMPDGGTLTIATKLLELTDETAEGDATPGHYVVVSVEDAGQGMDAETKARLFEPFFTTKPAGSGSGLGLATVYGIVAQSGGFVRVESEPGLGARFEVYFPQVEAMEELPGTPQPGLDEPAAAAGTVLLVEDEEVVRGLALTVLEDAGYRVVAAQSGVEALKIWEHRAGSFEVIVTDMVMPGVGGRELAERVLQDRAGMPVVLMSGYTEDAPLIETRGAPAPVFLQKPFAPHDLLAAIADARGRVGEAAAA